MRLFKATLARRDSATVGSHTWTEADRDLESLQRAIFGYEPEEPAAGEAATHAAIGPDDELGGPDEDAGAEN
jgi:hypothetical protein